MTIDTSTPKKNCLILMLAGPEVRQFGHSGFISQLLDSGWQVTVMPRIIDQDLIDQLPDQVTYVPLHQEKIPTKLHRLQRLLDRTYQILQSKQGKDRWIDAWKAETHSVWGRVTNLLIELLAKVVSHQPSFYDKLLNFEQSLELKSVSKSCIKFLKEHNISAVVLNTPRSEVLHPILIAAKRLGIPRFLYFHSIKDISAKGRLVHQFSEIGVWNDWMKRQLLDQNSNTIDPASVQITGCAHFDCVGRRDFLLPENIFRTNIGAKLNSRLLVYPAAVEWVVPDQGRYLWMVIRAIEDGFLPEDLQIVVRKNPMDLSDYFEHEFKHTGCVLVQNADWRMEPKGGWNFQRRADMVNFNSLLHYATLCFGIPSTVTIECAISCLPVVNIGFDLPDPAPPRSMRSFWEAEFYQQAVRHRIACFSGDEASLIKNIKTTLESPRPSPAFYKPFLSEYLGVPPHQAANQYFNLIEQISS